MHPSLIVLLRVVGRTISKEREGGAVVLTHPRDTHLHYTALAIGFLSEVNSVVFEPLLGHTPYKSNRIVDVLITLKGVLEK